MIEELTALYQSGRSIRAIAERVGMPRETVRVKLREVQELRPMGRPRDRAVEKEILHLYLVRKLSAVAVGRELRVSPQTVANVVIRHGYRMRAQRQRNVMRQCVDCREMAVPGCLRCERHRVFHRKRYQADYMRTVYRGNR